MKNSARQPQSARNKAPFVSLVQNRIPRRSFLRGAGVALALPFLEAMKPVFGSAETVLQSKTAPRRILGICNNLGLLPDKFFPSEGGSDYQLSPYLEEIAEYRDYFTPLSGVSHPGVDGSHSSDVSFLTAAPHPGGGGFKNTISLDQWIAMRVGHETRFASLTLGVNARQGRRSLSWTDSGALIPCENSAANVYRKLFLQGTPDEVDQQIRKLKLGASIMDTVAEPSSQLKWRLGSTDRERLDQYMTSVREVEKRLELAQAWEKRPKPEPSAPMPEDPESPAAFMEKTRLMYQMARLAFETDSTRSISLLLDSNNSPTIRVDGIDITDGYHNLSHHGRSEKKLKQLEAIDREQLRLLGQLMGDLLSVQEGERTLLDHTTILFGSNFGDANKHTTDNMPMLVAGGGFRHGSHLAFDKNNNYPLPNLFVSVMQDMGFETDQFASSTGTMRGLDVRRT